MTLIDDRGRVFGRLNVVDATIIAVLLVMIPIGYAAYRLFRDPPARLIAVKPGTLSIGPNTQVEVVGENFRPYMRVTFDGEQGGNFVFQNANSATVAVPALSAGKHDVVLYDYAHEVSRLKEALTVTVPSYPMIPVTVGGAFTELAPEQVTRFEKGLSLPDTGQTVVTIVEVGAARPSVARFNVGSEVVPVAVQGLRDLPATISISCSLQTSPDGLRRCFFGPVALAPGANIGLKGPGMTINFQVSDVHYSRDSRIVLAHVRFTLPAGFSGDVKAHDRDAGGRAFPSGVMADLVSFNPGGGGAAAVVSIEADPTATGWTYKGKPVKAGAPFTFETERYTLDGVITSVEFPGDKP